MVEVTVIGRDGGVIDKREINRDLFEEYVRREEANGDLATRWFARLLFYLFKPTSKGGSELFPIVDTSGAVRNTYAKKNTGANDLFNTTYGSDTGFLIAVGSGTATPTRDDFTLASTVAETYASAAVDEDAGVVTLSAAFTFATGQTITEVGLVWVTYYRMLCDRTVLSSPVTVPAGATLSVAYRFRL